MSDSGQKNNSWGIIIKATIISLVVGLASGVIGASLATRHLTSYANSLQVDTVQPLRINEQKPRPLPGSYEESLDIIRGQVMPSAATLYRAKAPADLTAYGQDEAVGYGIIFTSDGWLMTSGDIFKSLDAEKVMVNVGDNLFPVTKMELDPATGVAFVKIDANNLPVVAFAASQAVEAGDLMFVVPGNQTLLINSVTNPSLWISPTEVSSSEAFLDYLVLEESLNSGLIGSPVVNSVGELAGIYLGAEDGIELARPLHHISPATKSLLRSGEVVRTVLGVQSIDLSSSLGLSNEVTRSYKRGALIADNPYWGLPAVASGSPAALAELQENDIILSVGPELVSANNSLAELVSEYSPGDQVEFKVWRGGEELALTITLGPIIEEE